MSLNIKLVLKIQHLNPHPIDHRSLQPGELAKFCRALRGKCRNFSTSGDILAFRKAAARLPGRKRPQIALHLRFSETRAQPQLALARVVIVR